MKKLLLLFLLVAGGVSTVSAGTSTTLYYAVPANQLNNGTYTVRININHNGYGYGYDWDQVSMTKTSDTYFGKYIYSCTFTDKNNGLGCLQFQIMNGASVVHSDQIFGEQDWHEVSGYNGKMGEYGESQLRNYKVDKTVTIHCKKTNTWTPSYAHNYFADGVTGDVSQGSWPGPSTTVSSLNSDWYDIKISGRPCDYVIFNDGTNPGTENTTKTPSIAIGTDSEYWINGGPSSTTASNTLPADYNYTRTGLTDGKYGTICLPYAISAVSGATFYEITSKTANEINLSEVAAPAAGTPYIFQASGDSFTATLSGNYTAATSATGLIGNISSSPIYVPVDKYIISNNKVQKVVSGESGVTCGQYRAYINLEDVDVASSRGAISIGFADDETTGINNLTPALNEGVVYDLQGRKVAQPTKGLYIVNGKKVIK